MTKQEGLEARCINTIRFLAVDAVEKARSGHPGMPMGAAPLAFTLWTRHLKHNPVDPRWPDRDRFVLSAGHASMLLYALLHLTGYDLSLDDIRAFRQWGSRTPGHPEHAVVPGVEVTTGPLGQGLAYAVGMAAAEAHLAARFNRPNFPLVDHRTYVLASDGDLMEGVGAEACSLAGHLGLGKLIVLYDDNGVSLAGSTKLCFTEDVELRFRACGWQTLRVADGNDVAAIDEALRQARADTQRPSLICVRTTIGFGAPRKGGKSDAHGSPLGEEETRAAKNALGWPPEPALYVPEDAGAFFAAARQAGSKAQAAWEELLSRYLCAFPAEGAEFQRRMAGELPEGWERALAELSVEKQQPTRKVSEAVLQALAPVLPEIVGGSADLNPSSFTWLQGAGDFQRPDGPEQAIEGRVGGVWGYEGRNIHFGVREHAMAALAGGMALHGGLFPFTGTFFAFSDYMRPAMRLAALMHLRVLFLFTHDSIGLGEDGPTHQPVEQLMNLRSVPNLTVLRPADAAETVEAWRWALGNAEGPTVLVLTRQNVPVLPRGETASAEGLCRGGYILWESSTAQPEAILIGTGSEVGVALAAGRELAADGIATRVVSLPSWEIFDRQDPAYRDRVLPPPVRCRVAVEAGIRLGWEHYTGLDGTVVGLDAFGASAPAQELFARFGITAERVAEAARRRLKA